MAISVFPTEADIGTVEGDGQIATEENMATLLAGLTGPRNFVISGMSFSDLGGLNVRVGVGVAVISGYRVEITANEDFSVNASETTQAWYLKLNRTGDNVTSTSWVRVLDPSEDGSDDPADSVHLFTVDTNASDITASQDYRTYGGTMHGEYTGDGTSSRDITLPGSVRAKLIYIIGSGGTKANIVAVSGIYATGLGGMLGFYAHGSSSGPTTDESLRPRINLSGFRVSTHATNDNLNQSAELYRYLVIL